MPDPAQPAAEAPVPPEGGGPVSKLDELKKKYRLDAEVNLYARSDNAKPLGKGPLLDPQVFDKFAELDKTQNKRYLDWMLFQAGGGQEAFKRSRQLWGDDTEEKTPESFFEQFKSDKPDEGITYEELQNLAKKLKEKGVNIDKLATHTNFVEMYPRRGSLFDRFNFLVSLMKKHGVAPGKEERVAVEMIANKFKAWIKNQLSTKTRDRVHATSVYSRMIRGQTRAEAEAKWKEMEPRRRHEYIFGDQDSLKWDAFGYNRHWPGRNNIYEEIYNAMRQFLNNSEKVERYNTRLEAYNANIAEKNKALPPEQQIPPRQPLKFDLKIGTVLVDPDGNLSYKGSYPTLRSMVQANEELAELPMKERVAQDVRYAGPKGSYGRGTKLYSDANIDVRIPLTVAASIESGHASWPISDPSQMLNIKAKGSYSTSVWTNYATGQHRYAEWNNSQAIPVYFHIKTPEVAEATQRLLMVVFMDDLIDLKPPYGATKWYVSGTSEELHFTDIVRMFQTNRHTDQQSHAQYLSFVHSLTKAMNAIREWGKEFDPHDLTADYVAHHRERMQGKRTLGEEVRIRAYQAVEALLE